MTDARQLNDVPGCEDDLDVPSVGKVIRDQSIKGRHRLFYEGEERRAQVLELLRSGIAVKDAVAQVGIRKDTYLKWRKRDRRFAAECDLARAGRQALMADWEGSHAAFALRFFGMAYARHQLEFIEELERTPPGNMLMTLWPPEHGKTTTFENFVSERLATRQDYRITIGSESLRISEKILGRLKARMEPEGPFPEYVRTFGPFKPMAGLSKEAHMAQPWGAQYFNVAKKSRSDERDYSVQALGFNSSIVSTRTDHLHLDDIQSTKTLNQTDKMEDWVRQDALSRPGEYGITTIAGTRVGPDDIYSRLADDPGLDGILRVIRFPAIRTNTLTGEQEALWPERYDLEQLDRMRRKVGDEAWDRNYMQNPGSNPKDRTFTDQAIERSLNPLISLHHHVAEGAIVYAGLDPALGGQNCVMACEVTADNKLIIRMIREQSGLRQNEQIMAEVESVVRWCNLTGRLTDLVIETMNFQKGLANDERLADMRERYGFATRAHLTGRNKYDENIGIPSMVTSFLNGEIILPWAEDDLTRHEIGELVRQLRAWRPGQRGNKFRMDRVMALWFIWILWQARWKSQALDRHHAGSFKRQGLPYAPIGTRLILPTGVR
jgi:hypothetical protein